MIPTTTSLALSVQGASGSYPWVVQCVQKEPEWAGIHCPKCINERIISFNSTEDEQNVRANNVEVLSHNEGLLIYNVLPYYTATCMYQAYLSCERISDPTWDADVACYGVNLHRYIITFLCMS